MYPAIPKLQPNPTTGLPQKLPMDELLKYYNELTALGFQVVAKRRTAKHPVQSGWNSLKQADLKGSVQMELQSKPSASGWCIITGRKSNNLVVVDLDFQELINGGHTPEDVYRKIQELSTTRFVLVTPTGGLHLYYRIADDKSLTSSARVGYAGLDIRADNGLVASLGGYNRYEDNHEKKGVVRKHEGAYAKLPDGSYNEVPIMSDQLYDWLSSKLTQTVDRKSSGVHFGSDDMVRNYEHTEQGNARLDAHFKEPIEKREAIVIECLQAVFKRWGDSLSNDEWTQIWMSAYHGAPTQKVLHEILTNKDLHWSDGIVGKQKFQQRWNTHQWREGYTVASLFWIARKAGWLKLTGYEIPESYVEHINVKYITEWVEAQAEMPKHVLIESQTGSGKTRAIKRIWERTGSGKTVIFVPTIKLATELYYTLLGEGMPATLYRDEDKGTAIELEAMKKADVLVTTLQTFATKLFASGLDMRSYDLVYIEEIDQLLSGFALGGGSKYMVSHVTEQQARLGFQCLFEAYQYSGFVYGVDATMSQVSSSLAFQMTNNNVRVIRNDDIKQKAPVKFLSGVNEAYQVAYEALRSGKRTVIIADKASRAKEALNTMLALGVVTEDNSILMTRHTSAHRKVIKFMQDVNKGASDYKLVCYNSIMGSGVSITDVTPDVIVQICEYLPPRNNLQMLNRYRKQDTVYVSMRDTESLYAHTAQDILDEAKKSVDIEAGLIRLPVSTRGNIALIRDSLASISIADQQAQWRSPYLLYRSLLETDGRTVHTDEITLSGVMEHTIKKIRKIQREQNNYIYANWHTVRPINEENPATADMTDMEVALGIHHAMIHKALRGNIPDIEKPETAEYVSDVVRRLKPHSFALSEFMQQGKALTRAERFVLDGDKPLIAIQNSMSKIQALSILEELYLDMRSGITDVELKTKAPKFLQRMQENKQLYNAVIARNRERFENLYNADDLEGSAIKLAKSLLRQIGLRQKKVRVRKGGVDYRLEISNLDEVEDFLKWRNTDNPDFKLAYTFTSHLDEHLDARRNSDVIFASMSEEKREKVLELLKSNHTFASAVESVHSGLLM